MIVNYQKYIKQCFTGIVDFKGKTECIIHKNGHGIDRAILKIVCQIYPMT